MKRMQDRENVFCQICGEQKTLGELVPADSVRSSVIDLIRKDHPEWSDQGYICIADLNHYRAKYVEELLEKEKGEVSTLEEKVISAMEDRSVLSQDTTAVFDRQLTLGERVADRIADFAGSWTFIILFFIVLVVWVAINSIILLARPFDPYPFILLNLVLSCIAAIQAPVIIMSQNRQEARDRLQAQHDYQVNLKAELEIQNLHEKMDHLLINQGQRLLEIQNIQVELMEELARRKS
jgi:uncharacterized membrane protein